MSDLPFEEIEEKIGYTFRDKQLLRRCFVHSSYTNEHKEEVSNEKLEFLGDAVLELILSEKLYFESETEGDMTMRRQRFVSDESLKKVVEELSLSKYLFVGGGRQNLGKKAIPSLMEALIAGIYLDGGYGSAKKFVYRFVAEQGGTNYVGALQEFLQSKGMPLPEYEYIGVTGTENAPTFSYRVTAYGKSAIGQGSGKKAARMNAAKNLFLAINKK